MHRIKISTKITGLLLGIGVLTGAWALDSDQYQLLRVIADSATYDRNQHTITYQGKVQVEQGTSHLDGDRVVVYQMPSNTNKIQKIIAYGKPAHYSTIPAPTKSRLYVEALKITYDPVKETVLLEGRARVNQDGNLFSGSHIQYDMANGVVHSLTAPGAERTEVIFQPQQPEKNKS